MGKKTWRLVLASASPRRREILKGAGFSCTVIPSNSSESFSENLTLEENLCAISEDKVAGTVALLSPRKQKGIIVLAADTVVVVGGKVLGKPKNPPDARRMLRLLSGKTHKVMTAFSVYSTEEKRGVTRVVTTGVSFRKLSEKDIQCYIDSDEPFDKAGAYAIQGRARDFVKAIDGDLLNVVGLPITEFKKELRKQRWNVGVRNKPSKRSKKNPRRRKKSRS